VCNRSRFGANRAGFVFYNVASEEMEAINTKKASDCKKRMEGNASLRGFS